MFVKATHLAANAIKHAWGTLESVQVVRPPDDFHLVAFEEHVPLHGRPAPLLTQCTVALVFSRHNATQKTANKHVKQLVV